MNEYNVGVPTDEDYKKGKSSIIVIVYLLLFPIGVLLIWFWSGWKLHSKIIATIAPLILGPLIYIVFYNISSFMIDSHYGTSDFGHRLGLSPFAFAITKYHNFYEEYPWDADSTFIKPKKIGNEGIPTVIGGTKDNPIYQGWVEEVMKTEETRSPYYPGDFNTPYYIWFDEDEHKTTVCFNPSTPKYEPQANADIYANPLPEGSPNAELICFSNR